jgi:hypothetical protein
MLTRIAAASMATLLACAHGNAQIPPCFDFNIGTNLNLADDATALNLQLGFTFNYAGVPYTAICVCSNGYIWFGPTAGATVPAGGDYTPTLPELLNGPPRLCPLWTDFNPAAAGSGKVYFNALPPSGTNPAQAVITWAGVYEFGRTVPITMQVILDANHNIFVTYDNNASTVNGGTAAGTAPQVIVGASPGMGATATPDTFAPRPVLITQDNFAEVIPVPVPGFPYGGVSMLWLPTPPAGYLVLDRTCTPGPLPPPASFTKFGVGCPPRVAPVVYEVFANNGNVMDLSNLSFRFVPDGLGGYLLSQPGGSWFSGFANNLNAGDDTTHVLALPFPFQFAAASLSTIVASSNGFLWMTSVNGGAACCAPVVATFLSAAPRISPMWTDLNASTTSTSGFGAVYADLDPATGQYVVTWNQVGEFGVTPRGAAQNTFQVALHPNGVFDIRYQTVQHAHATRAALAGVSGGNGAADPGMTNLSAVIALPIPGVEPLDLSAATGSLPRFGQTFTMNLSGLPASSFAVLSLSFAESVPPIDLGPLGAPLCFAYPTIFGSVFNFFLFPGGAPSIPFSLAVPVDPSLAGVAVVAQGLAPAPVNPLGLKLSNGGRMIVGL